MGKPGFTGTVSGSLSDGASPAANVAFVLALRCQITYPPLAAVCQVTACWKG
ncbi:MAG: hypothetical protein JO368_03860 [Acidimicrobiales bacterium]|nr:hypothetical protein [Acidimicrobiales bacterium]